jgi:hypothetical protein
MKNNKAVKVNEPTPFVECMYPFLQQPNVSTDPNIRDSFKITVLLNGKDEDQAHLLKKIEELYKQSGGKINRGERGHPIKYHITEELSENDSGESEVKRIKVPNVYEVTFKTLASIRDHIPTYDMQGNDVWREKNYVANLSIVRVQWSYQFYEVAGNKGMSLYLDAVQVKDLKEWVGKNFADFNFDTGDGYVKDDTVEKEFPEGGETAEPTDDFNEQDGDPTEDGGHSADQVKDSDDLPF